MRKLNLNVIALGSIGLMLFSCDKEDAAQPVSVVQPETIYAYSEKTKVYDSENLSYAVVTIEAKTQEALNKALEDYKSMELVYTYPSAEECAVVPDFSEFKYTYSKRDKEVRDSLKAEKLVNVHYDFTSALANHKKTSDKPIGFGVEPQKSMNKTVTYYVAQGPVGSTTASPLADGYSIKNVGPKATWDVYIYNYVGVFSWNLNSGVEIIAAYLPAYENQMHYIEGVDITWPYQNVLASGFWYYQ